MRKVDLVLVVLVGSFVSMNAFQASASASFNGSNMAAALLGILVATGIALGVVGPLRGGAEETPSSRLAALAPACLCFVAATVLHAEHAVAAVVGAVLIVAMPYIGPALAKRLAG